MFGMPMPTIVSKRASASTGVVGVNGCERAIVARVHRGEHVDRLTTTNLAEDDAVGTHSEAVLDELTLGDLALAFEVGRARLEADDVGLLQLELRGVLDGDDALAFGNEGGEHVEQGGLSGARAAADDDS